jgi:phage shock protein A
MITQGQFNRAMQEVNDSYAKMVAQIRVLEERIAELEKKPEPAPKKAPAKKKDS